MCVHGVPAGNSKRIQGPAVCTFIGMPSFLESRNTGVSQLPTWESVGGFTEMACADGSAPVPDAVSPRRLWSSALSQSRWPSEGARWHVPALSREQTHPRWWAARLTCSRLHACGPRTFISPAQKSLEPGRLQVLPFLSILMALLQAVPKPERSRGAVAVVQVKAASHLPPLHQQSGTVSVCLNQAFSARFRGTPSAQSPWPFQKDLKSFKSCEMMRTWNVHLKNKRKPDDTWLPRGERPDLAELLGIAGSLNLQAISVSESPVSWLPGLVRTTSPGPWNKTIPEWSLYLLAPTSCSISCYSSWVLHSDRGCQ